MFPTQRAPQSKIILEYKNKTEDGNRLHNSSNSNERKVAEDIIGDNDYKKILSSQLNQLPTTTTITVPTTIEQKVVEDIVGNNEDDSLKQVTANTDSNTSLSRIGSNYSSAKSSPSVTTELHSVDENHSDNSNDTVLGSSIDKKNSNDSNDKNGTTDIDYDDTTQYYYQYLSKKEKALLKKLRQDIKILNERTLKLAEQMNECISETEKDEVEKRLNEEIDFLMCAEAKLERLIAPKCIYNIWDSYYGQRHEDTKDYMNLSYYSDNTVYFYKGDGTAAIEIKNPDIKTGHDFWKLINSMRAECAKNRKEGKEYYFENYLLKHNLITKEDLAEKSPTGFEAHMRNMDRRIRREYANREYRI